MSRIGLKPIIIPSNVSIEKSENGLEITGSKGKLSVKIPKEIKVEMTDGLVSLTRKVETREAKALHGLTRSLVANAIDGVREGYSKQLEVNGVGFKVNLNDNQLVLSLGFSHDVNYKLPSDITASVDQNIITISGIDKQRVGQITAEIRALKKPEPYKGKGIKYVGEYIIRKAGKAASGGKD